MSEKLLKYLIYIGGLFALYAFLAVRFLPMYNLALVENRHPDYFEFMQYGEMYYFSQIAHFKEDMPFPESKFRLSDRNASLDDARIIAFGDSFFDFNRQKTVAERLSDNYQLPVHAANAWFPLEYLAQMNYQKGERKIFIFEIVENIHFRFENPHNLHPHLISKTENEGLKSMVKAVKDKVFLQNGEELYNVLLKGNYITEPFYTAIATLKFDAFGYISPLSPLYSLSHNDSPLLFYYRTVDDYYYTSFYFEHTDEMIRTYCDNLEKLAKTLDEEYNLEMVFLPIPNKYTLYYGDINPEDVYDEFLPRLNEEMNKRDINYVNIYDDFKKSDLKLFYGTDTHWNKAGVDIAVDNILQLFDNEDSLRSILNLSLKQSKN